MRRMILFMGTTVHYNLISLLLILIEGVISHPKVTSHRCEVGKGKIHLKLLSVNTGYDWINANLLHL